MLPEPEQSLKVDAAARLYDLSYKFKYPRDGEQQRKGK
jgi:hypothetical protein